MTRPQGETKHPMSAMLHVIFVFTSINHLCSFTPLTNHDTTFTEVACLMFWQNIMELMLMYIIRD